MDKHEKHIELLEFRTELRNILDKANTHFEKQLTLIATGAFGLSVLIAKYLFPEEQELSNKTLLLIGWVLLVCALMLNLFSHLITFRYHAKTIAEIDDNAYNEVKANQRNKTIDWINWICGSMVVFALILLVVFFKVNL
jgi:hypothetical protein